MGFAVAAEAYDRFMGEWSRPLSPQLVAFAGLKSGQRALDVGCGPGVLTEELAEALGPSAVSAVDPSETFVEAARRRLPGVDVRVALAEDLPFESGTFDATLAQLVVHFMTDPVAGLAEMGRVTRRGGVVAASVWDFGGGRGPLGPFWEVATQLDPVSTDESHLPATNKGELVRLMEAAGLGAVEGSAFVVTRSFASFDDWWEPFTAGVGPAGSYVARLGAGQRERLRSACRSRLPDGPFRLDAAAWAARGVVPRRG